jgi:hypothetical protein
MSKTVDLTGITQNSSIQFKRVDSPQSLLFKNVPINGKIEVKIVRNGIPDDILIPQMTFFTLSQILKFTDILVRSNYSPLYIDAKSNVDVVSQEILPFLNVFLSRDGEIPLADDDYVNVSVTSMNKPSDCNITSIGGDKLASTVMRILKEKWDASDDNYELVNAESKALAFFDTLPEEMTINYDTGQTRRLNGIDITGINFSEFEPIYFDRQVDTFVEDSTTMIPVNITNAISVRLTNTASQEVTIYTLEA